MPLIKRIGPYEFRFYSRREREEPPHIHIRRGRLEAKFWLTPVPRVARPGRFPMHELNEIQALVEENQQEFLNAWHTYFG